MTKDDEIRIDKAKGVFYHETGHLIGYILSNKDDSTKLGKVKSLELGFQKNSVTPEIYLYHYSNYLKEGKYITENTRKVERTIAWFIEVILGCTFQYIYDGYPFLDCFRNASLGQDDFHNLIAIQGLSSFKFKMEDIDFLQDKLRRIVEKHEIINKITIPVEELVTSLKSDPIHQIELSGKELDLYIYKIDKILPHEFYTDYLDLINWFKKTI